MAKESWIRRNILLRLIINLYSMIGAFAYKNINGIVCASLVRVYKDLSEVIKCQNDDIEYFEASVNDHKRFTVISYPFNDSIYKLDINETLLSFEELKLDPYFHIHRHYVTYGIHQFK